MNKTALITGATSGFGLATAKALANKGYQLILLGRRTERLHSLAQELPVATHLLALDIRDNDAIKQAIAHLPDEFKQVSLLINNAGLALGLESSEHTDLDNWHCMLDTNIKGLVNITHALLPTLVAQRSASIINLSSVAANWPYPGANVYGASKAFVSQFSYNLRADLVGKGVRVTSLEPGMAETEFSLVRFAGDQSKAQAVYQGVEAICANDVANIIVWIAEQPAHLNINRLEFMPEQQAFNHFQVVRR